MTVQLPGNAQSDKQPIEVIRAKLANRIINSESSQDFGSSPIGYLVSWYKYRFTSLATIGQIWLDRWGSAYRIVGEEASDPPVWVCQLVVQKPLK